MKNSLIVGMAIGMAAGACIASNSRKAREVVTGTQDAIKNKFCAQKQPNVQIDCEGGTNDVKF